MKPYSDAALQRYYHSDYCGVIGDGPGVGSAQLGTAESGEVVRMQVQLDEAGVIRQVRFKAQGCCALIASAALLCELADQQSSHVVATISHEEIIKTLDLPRVKIHSAVLALEALKAALDEAD